MSLNDIPKHYLTLKETYELLGIPYIEPPTLDEIQAMGPEEFKKKFSGWAKMNNVDNVVDFFKDLEFDEDGNILLRFEDIKHF